MVPPRASGGLSAEEGDGGCPPYTPGSVETSDACSRPEFPSVISWNMEGDIRSFVLQTSHWGGGGRISQGNCPDRGSPWE